MNRLTFEQLKELIETRNGVRVSLFLPTQRKSVESRQNPIRFKNLLAEAEQRLLKRGLSEQETTEFLKAARELQEDYEYWQEQEDGLAVFLSQRKLREFRLPAKLDEDVYVGDRFYVKPLLAEAVDRNPFHILVLSENAPRLLHCTRHTATCVQVDGMPDGLDAILGYVDSEKQLQFHTGAAPGGGRQRPALFHGQGSGTHDDKKVRLFEYYRKIDTSLQPVLANQRSPLVLAGVESHFPIYREASSHHTLIEGATGNLDSKRPEQIHEESWESVAPVFQKEQEEALEHLAGLLGTGQASADYHLIVPAARHGRVDTLFFAPGTHLWGRFDAASGEVDVHEQGLAGDEELIDFSVTETLLRGGKVYAVQDGQLPVESSLAAVFRY